MFRFAMFPRNVNELLKDKFFYCGAIGGFFVDYNNRFTSELMALSMWMFFLSKIIGNREADLLVEEWDSHIRSTIRFGLGITMGIICSRTLQAAMPSGPSISYSPKI